MGGIVYFCNLIIQNKEFFILSKLNKSVAIIGAGNIGSSIALGLMSSGIIENNKLTVTRRLEDGLSLYKNLGNYTTTNNTEAVEKSEIIILCVTPQQLNGVLEEIAPALSEKKHVIMSVVSGASISQIKERTGNRCPVVRVMPNTAIAIKESMTCISGLDSEKDACELATKIFDSVGQTLVIHEELMVPATALCACGIAFFMRAIRAASQGGIEIGFHAEDSLFMAAQTAKGAATLLLNKGIHPESEVDKVTTPKGCTIAGLNQMEHSGFSSSLIKGIVTSAQKAETLYK